MRFFESIMKNVIIVLFFTMTASELLESKIFPLGNEVNTDSLFLPIEMRFLAFVTVLNLPNDKILKKCLGFLFTGLHVITDSSCIHHSDLQLLAKPGECEVYVMLGYTTNEGDGTWHRYQFLDTHPCYKPRLTCIYSLIGIITLKYPVVLSDYIQPIPLLEESNVALQNITPINVYGLKMIESTSQSYAKHHQFIPKVVCVSIISLEECEPFFPDIHLHYITHSCAVSDQSIDNFVTQEYIGSPLIHNEQVIGTVSHSSGDKTAPFIFANILYARNFIRYQMTRFFLESNNLSKSV